MSAAEKFISTKPGQYAVVGVVGAVVFVLVYKFLKREVVEGAQAVGGLASGNNAATRSATNAAGERVTAYEGAGILGTLGAAANAASGGLFASWGQELGGWTYDMTHPSSSGD